ncbi:MAG: hypothetical protein H0T46_27865 [Deltaproteobacteria bacterium]|nr:hypothetical protein [Deltaproteobacteria bacterium]
MRRALLALLALLLAACTNTATDPDPEISREHHPRFHGWWVVAQPFHALYEETYYDFAPDGTLTVGPSDPADCSGHLSEHCVTGSVAKMQTSLSCVFGASWYSLDASHVAIAGDCSDQVPRDIVIELAADPSSNTSFGGAGGTVVSVGGEPDWSHDNWDWVFRKCPSGSTPTSCLPQ